MKYTHISLLEFNDLGLQRTTDSDIVQYSRMQQIESIPIENYNGASGSRRL
jgi:hypothetical protein